MQMGRRDFNVFAKKCVYRCRAAAVIAVYPTHAHTHKHRLIHHKHTIQQWMMERDMRYVLPSSRRPSVCARFSLPLHRELEKTEREHAAHINTFFSACETAIRTIGQNTAWQLIFTALQTNNTSISLSSGIFHGQKSLVRRWPIELIHWPFCCKYSKQKIWTEKSKYTHSSWSSSSSSSGVHTFTFFRLILSLRIEVGNVMAHTHTYTQVISFHEISLRNGNAHAPHQTHQIVSNHRIFHRQRLLRIKCLLYERKGTEQLVNYASRWWKELLCAWVIYVGACSDPNWNDLEKYCWQCIVEWCNCDIEQRKIIESNPMCTQ